MAIIQPNKLKVWPVMDYRELNQYIDTYMADADVCTSCGSGTRKIKRVITGSEEGLSASARSTKLYGHFSRWYLVVKGTVWPSLVLCCSKRRQSKRRHQHNLITFTSMMMSAQRRTSELIWHSLAWISRIQSSLKTEHAYWAWTSGGRKAPCNQNGEEWFWVFLKFSQGRLFFPCAEN